MLYITTAARPEAAATAPPSSLFRAGIGPDAERPPLFSRDSRRADYVQSYPGLDALCERCGFGWDGTLGECSVEPELLLLALARGARTPAVPAGYPVALFAPVRARIAALIARHRLFDGEIRRIGILVRHLSCSQASVEVRRLAGTVDRLRHGLQLHLLHNELEVFPLALARAAAPAGPAAPAFTAVLGFMGEGQRDIARMIGQAIAEVEAAASGCTDPDLAILGEGLRALAVGFQVHAEAEMGLMGPLGDGRGPGIPGRGRLG
jgi:hypothetical protein